MEHQTRKGLFSRTRKEGSLRDAQLRIAPLDMGGPSHQLRSGFGATLTLEGERFLF